jgi:hypothetical protein
VWNRYLEYCNKVGIGDNIFLYAMSQQEWIKIMEAFAVAVHQGQFLQQCDAPLAESTLANTINAVAETFRENGHNYPKKDAKNEISRFLRWQLRSYKKDDPKEKKQKALPVCVLPLVLSSKSTELQ